MLLHLGFGLNDGDASSLLGQHRYSRGTQLSNSDVAGDAFCAAVGRLVAGAGPGFRFPAVAATWRSADVRRKKNQMAKFLYHVLIRGQPRAIE
jgi:hypothetical protein